jgi:hypothetical protein
MCNASNAYKEEQCLDLGIGYFSCLYPQCALICLISNLVASYAPTRLERCTIYVVPLPTVPVLWLRSCIMNACGEQVPLLERVGA